MVSVDCELYLVDGNSGEACDKGSRPGIPTSQGFERFSVQINECPYG